MKTEVQEKDEKAAEGQGTEEVQAKLPFEIKGQEDIERLFEKYPNYRDEFLKDPKAFIAKYGSTEKKEEEPEGKPERTEKKSEKEAGAGDEEWLPKSEETGEKAAATAEALRVAEESKKENQRLRDQVQATQNE